MNANPNADSLYTLGVGCIVYILATKVTDTNYFTESNVIVPHSFEEEALKQGKVDQTAIEQEREKNEAVHRDIMPDASSEEGNQESSDKIARS